MANGLYEQIEKHRDYKDAPEVQKEKEYNRRRILRKQRSKEIKSDRTLFFYKKLYVISGVIVLFGIVFTFGSTIRSLGEGSFLWSERHVFSIFGPILLGIGVFLTLVASGLVFQRKVQVIEEKDLSRQNSSYSSLRRQLSQETYQSKRTLSREVSVDSNSTDYRINKLQRSNGFPGRSPDDSDGEIFLESSSSSTSSYLIGGTPFSLKWETLRRSTTEMGRPKPVRQNAINCPAKELPGTATSGAVERTSSVSCVINETDEFDKDRTKCSTKDVFLEGNVYKDVWVPRICSSKKNGAGISYKQNSNHNGIHLPVIKTTDTNANTTSISNSVGTNLKQNSPRKGTQLPAIIKTDTNANTTSINNGIGFKQNSNRKGKKLPVIIKTDTNANTGSIHNCISINYKQNSNRKGTLLPVIIATDTNANTTSIKQNSNRKGTQLPIIIATDTNGNNTFINEVCV